MDRRRNLRSARDGLGYAGRRCRCHAASSRCGFIIGAISLSSFILVIWGFGDGNLGAGGCNNSREGCETVFRARATCFATTSWLCLLLAWEMLDMCRSVVRIHGRAKNAWTGWMKHLWANQVLFWVSALISGGVVVLYL